MKSSRFFFCIYKSFVSVMVREIYRFIFINERIENLCWVCIGNALGGMDVVDRNSHIVMCVVYLVNEPFH